MRSIRISITKFISNDQPGFVECVFMDAWNKEHIFHEKVPIVTDKDLDSYSNYPQEGVANCEIIREWDDKLGRKVITVTTCKPWGIESLERIEQFDLLGHQIIK